MKHLLKVFNTACLICCLAGSSQLIGQEKQTRNYKEDFTVKPDAVVDINVSHTDISFETWDKNQVSVEATVELEGATAEEAKKFFEEGGIEILGNSSLVEIRTSGAAPFPPMPPHPPMGIDFPEFPEMEQLFLDLRIPDLPPLPDMPPMPPVNVPHFDYDKYKKDGDKYLQKWKSEFDKNFDKEYRKEMEAWSKKMAAGAEERGKHIEKWQEEQQKIREEHGLQREAVREMAREQRELAREHQEEAREHARKVQREMVISRNGRGEAPHIFYRSSDGESKNFKIKKTIKIKIPQSVKLKMNVRHGEVKLAENTKNMEANLAYASLFASTIDGEKTQITASYSPVNVRNWNFGTLRTDFSDKVALIEVRDLELKSNSSNVTIDRLMKSASIINNLGQLHINSVADDFNTVEIELQNAEMFCSTPSSAFSIQINGTSSEFTPPAYLHMTNSGDQRQFAYKGYHLNSNSSRSILINSRFSEVTLQK